MPDFSYIPESIPVETIFDYTVMIKDTELDCYFIHRVGITKASATQASHQSYLGSHKSWTPTSALNASLCKFK